MDSKKTKSEINLSNNGPKIQLLDDFDSEDNDLNSELSGANNRGKVEFPYSASDESSSRSGKGFFRKSKMGLTSTTSSTGFTNYSGFSSEASNRSVNIFEFSNYVLINPKKHKSKYIVKFKRKTKMM